MGITKRCGLFVLSFAVLLTTSFGAFSDKAFAASDYDDIVQITPSLKVKYTGKDDLDVTSNYMGYFKNILTDDVSQYDCGANGTTDPTNCNNIINDSLDHGDWIIMQQSSAYPTDHTIVSAQFCDQKITTIEGFTNPQGNYKYLFGDTSVPAKCLNISMQYQSFTNGLHLSIVGQISTGVSQYAMTIGSEYLSGGSWHNDNKQFLFTSTAPYPSDYGGVQIPDTYTPPQTAHFAYAVDTSGKLSAIFNQDIPIEAGMEWSWTLSQTDVNYANPTQLDHKTLGITDVYQYSPLQIGHYYTLEVRMYAPIPFTPPVDDFHTTFQIFYFGQFIGHSSDSSDCSNGVCTSPTAVCTTSGDVWLDLGCTLQKSTAIGVLNPSINAFKSLFSSLVVPSSTVCNLSISNVTLPGGGVFPLSQYGPQACSAAASLRGAFPLAPLLVNFMFALLILRMLASIVNELLDDKRSDVIGGV